MAKNPFRVRIGLGSLDGYASDAAYVSATGTTPKQGDMYFNTATGSYRTYNGTSWNNSGNVLGPASSTTNAVPTFADTSGQTLLNTGVTIDTSNNLSVPGTVHVTPTGITGIQEGLRLVDQGSGSNEGLYIRWDSSGKTDQARIGQLSNTTSSGSNLLFYTNSADSGSALERMRIIGTGNVLIGTTTDAGQLLQVNGTTSALRYLSTSSNASLPALDVGSGDGIYNNGTHIVGFTTNSTFAGNIDAAQGLRWGTTSAVGVSTAELVTIGFTPSDATAANRDIFVDLLLNQNVAYTNNSAAIFPRIRRIITASQTDTGSIYGIRINNDYNIASGQTLTANNSSTGYAGIYINNPTNGGAGTLAITNYSGIQIATSSLNTGTNKFGIMINDQTGATNNYAIKSGLGLVSIGDTTASTSSSTGALTVTGGAGIGGALWTAGVGRFGSTGVIAEANEELNADYTTTDATSSSSAFTGRMNTNQNSAFSGSNWMGGDFLHIRSITSSVTESSGNTMSALRAFQRFNIASGQTLTQTSGSYQGLMIAAPVNSGAGTLALTSYSGINIAASSLATGTNKYGITIGSQTGASNNFAISTGSGIVAIGDTTTSSSATTGALTVAGGAGISGAVHIGGTLSLNGSSSGTFTQTAANTTTSYTVKWPSAQGAASTFLTNDGSGNLSWTTVPGSGTVTSVGLSLPSIFNVTVSPITSSGTLTAVFNTQTANTVFAGPSSGSAATPTFRSLVPNDIPTAFSIPNPLINSNFDFWQRGTTFTGSSSIYTADRWFYNGSNATTISRQSFTAGQTAVPNNPTYYIHMVDSGVVTLNLAQRIENVSSLSGETVTVTFWAQTNTAGGFADSTVAFNQNFGSGGSATVNGTPQTFTISSSNTWQKFSFTFSIASISGKTVGPGSFLELQFLADTSVNGTSLDIAQVSINLGSSDAPWSYASGGTALNAEAEFAMCQRYCEQIGPGACGAASSSTTAELSGQFKVTKRASPSFTASTSQYRIRSGGADFLTTAAPTLANTTATVDGFWTQVTNFSGLTTGAVTSDRGNTYLAFATAEL